MTHWRYFKYLLRHKWYVALECFRYRLYFHAFTHDLSKFRPSEWFPYANYFYGEYPKWDEVKHSHLGYSWWNTEEGVSYRFDAAWLEHQHRNKHHWQHWVLREDEGQIKLIPMPVRMIKQMTCDWIGASKAIRGRDASPVEWYEKVKKDMLLHESSRRYFEILIKT